MKYPQLQTGTQLPSSINHPLSPIDLQYSQYSIFILNSLDIYPNHDELSAMMAEADVANKGYINESDFKYIIAKQKKEYRDKLMKEAKDAFIALGGDPDLHTKISTGKIQEILRKEFELSEELEITLKKIAQNKDEISFEDFMKFFQ